MAARSQVREFAAAAAVWLPAAVIAVNAANQLPGLPETVPTHWGGFGQPDRYSDTTATLAWLLLLAAAAGVAATVACVRATVAPVVRRGLLGSTGAVAGTVAAIWMISTASADPPTLGWRALWLVPGLFWGLVVHAVAGKPTSVVGPLPAPAGRRLDIADGERAAWMVTLRSRMLTVVTALATVAIGVAAVTVSPGFWLAGAAIAFILAVFAQVVVVVDRRGLRLVSGLLGVPFKRIALGDITAAGAEHVDALHWGGWGYRMRPGGSAFVLRSGPGLVLDLRSGRRFAVTVPDPDTPAALLTTLLVRRIGGPR